MDFILHKPNLLPRTICETLVSKFNGDPSRSPISYPNIGTPKELAGSEYLQYDGKSKEWESLDNKIFSLLDVTLKEYIETYTVMLQENEELSDTAYVVLKMKSTMRTILTPNTAASPYVLRCIVFLNDDKDSSLYFPLQDKRIPITQGTVVIYPPFFTHRYEHNFSDTQYMIATNYSINTKQQ